MAKEKMEATFISNEESTIRILTCDNAHFLPWPVGLEPTPRFCPFSYGFGRCGAPMKRGNIWKKVD